MKSTILLCLLLLLVSCGKGGSSAHTIDSIPDNLNVKWETSKFPLVMNASSALRDSRPDLTDAMESAANSWNSALGTKLGKNVFDIQFKSQTAIDNAAGYKSSDYGGTPEEKKNQACQAFIRDALQVISLKQDWSSFPCGGDSSLTLAVTVFGTISNTLQHADIILNDQYFNFNSNPSSGEIDLESVLVHEMGHAIGLKHICASASQRTQNPSYGCVEGDYDADSIMNPTITQSQIKRFLSPDDIIRVQSLY